MANIEKKRPFLSVIIPVYNAEMYLVRCLNSIIFQNFKDLEIVIVNDGSIDNSHQIIQNYVDMYNMKYTMKYIIHDTNKGVAQARQTGIDNSDGEYITFLDADDFVMPQLYEMCYIHIQRHHSEILSIDSYDFPSEFMDMKNILAPDVGAPAESILEYNMDCRYGTAMWYRLVRRDLYGPDFYPKDLGFDLVDDIYGAVLLMTKAKSVDFLALPLYVYYMGKEESHSRNNFKIGDKVLKTICALKDRVYPRIQELGLENTFHYLQARYMWFYALIQHRLSIPTILNNITNGMKFKDNQETLDFLNVDERQFRYMVNEMRTFSMDLDRAFKNAALAYDISIARK